MGRNAEPNGNNSRASSSGGSGKNGSFYAIGGVIVAGTLLLSVLGSKAAIGYMQNQSNNRLKQFEASKLEQQEKEWQEKMAAQQEAYDELAAELEDYREKYAFTTDQLDWAHENHIEWDEDGFPVNERGKVVDDPTTRTDEVERYEAFLKAQEEPEPEPEVVKVPDKEDKKPASSEEKTEEVEQEPETNWWDGLDFIQVDEDGNPYYVVQRGDTLSAIGARTGFSWKQLAEYNNLQNPSLLEIGQIIKFPKDGQLITDGATGKGRG